VACRWELAGAHLCFAGFAGSWGYSRGNLCVRVAHFGLRIGVGCRTPCADCLRDGERVPAGYSCMEAKCDLKPLCDSHVGSHKRWGHAVTVLVADDGAPGHSTLLGVTHCPKPEHAGPEGCLTLVCKECEVLLCRACGDEHLNLGHTVRTADLLGKEQASAISAALPELQQGLAHQTAQAAQAHSLLETLALNRNVALEALAAATARLHAEVDAKQAAMVREIDDAYESKAVGLQRALSAARAGAAELATMVATAEAALAGASTSRSCDVSGIMRVHVSRSVEASLPLARCRDAVVVDVRTLAFEVVGLDYAVDALVLGKMVAPAVKPASVSALGSGSCSDHRTVVCLWYPHSFVSLFLV
jgi:hypothetical protein